MRHLIMLITITLGLILMTANDGYDNYDGYDVSDEQLAEQLATYQRFAKEDPVGYTKMVLGIDLWKKQRMIMEALNAPCDGTKMISVASGNGVGKTFLIGAMTCNQSDINTPGYVVLSGASGKSITKTVWPTLKKVINEAPVDLGGKIDQMKWYRGDMWQVFWTSPDVPENFGGFRTENGVVIIVDEASSLSYESHEAILGIASASGSAIVYFGNPIRLDGPFKETFDNPDWINFQISSYEVCDLGIKGLATRPWIEERKREWGENDPRYKARVLGEFPEHDDFTLIPASWRKSYIIEKTLRPKGTRRLGVDVARYGNDASCFIMRDDRCMRASHKHYKIDLMEVVAMTRKYMDMYNVEPANVHVDDTGIGGGVTDRLKELGIHITPINFGAGAIEKEHFLNRRAEMYWNLKTRLDPKSSNQFFIPKRFEGIAKQLSWTQWKPSSDDRIKLESKDDIRKRLKHSPDDADALALTFAKGVAPWSISAV